MSWYLLFWLSIWAFCCKAFSFRLSLSLLLLISLFSFNGYFSVLCRMEFLIFFGVFFLNEEFFSFGSSFSGDSNCWLVFRICSGDVKVNISSEMKKKKAFSCCQCFCACSLWGLLVFVYSIKFIIAILIFSLKLKPPSTPQDSLKNINYSSYPMSMS